MSDYTKLLIVKKIINSYYEYDYGITDDFSYTKGYLESMLESIMSVIEYSDECCACCNEPNKDKKEKKILNE